MTRSVDTMRRLWAEGYTVADIASRLKLSRSTIYNHLRDAKGDMPARPWATAGMLNQHPMTIERLHLAGYIRKRGAMYSTEDTERYFAERAAEKCRHVGCDNLVTEVARNVKFCALHRRSGIDPSRVIDIVTRAPGITRGPLYQALRASKENAQEALGKMIAEGKLVEVRKIVSGRKSYAYYIPETAEAQTK